MKACVFLCLLWLGAGLLVTDAQAADLSATQQNTIKPPRTPASPTITAPVISPTSAPVTAPVAVEIVPSARKSIRLSPVQQQRVAQRVPLVKKQIADLSVDEQRAVLRRAAPPRQKLTDADRAARSKATRDAWAVKTSQQKTELRQKFLTAWQKLSPEDRAYRRARMTEQLQALPEADRKAVIAPFVASNAANMAIIPTP